MAEKRALERVSFSPGEFATLFGKSQTWGYRQIYAGKVKTIVEYGRLQIPASEVERILASAARYEGQKKAVPRTKSEFQARRAELQAAWRHFVASKNRGNAGSVKKPTRVPHASAGRGESRQAVMSRLTRGSRGA
ncbi:MAG: hypothetical protein WCF18_15665 [Chthoniobacteraceae bacterium]